MIYGYDEMKSKECDVLYVELMSKINRPDKKSDRNYDGKYSNYRFKNVQNIIKDDLAYHNPIIINCFAEWRVMIDNNWDYKM